MDRIIIIHYNEIALKGKNRGHFEDLLLGNIKQSLKEEKSGKIFKIFGRMIIRLSKDSDVSSIAIRLKKIFGIAYFAFGFEGPYDFEKLKEEVWSALDGIEFDSFRITTKRSDKSYKYDSREIDRLMGSRIWEGLEKMGKKPRVDLETPDLNVVLEITSEGVFFYFQLKNDKNANLMDNKNGPVGKIRCFGGIPSGSSGKVVSLISGGIDSPVASWKMMRRGARVIFIHFHSYPSTSLASKENVRALIKILNDYQGYSKAYFVPFLEIQKQIVLNCDASYGVILYRRFMMRIAEKIAEIEGAQCLIAGDSLGQVASQTLENIVAISQSVKTPILRPLVGENKDDIIELSQKIGAFEISSQPQEDCCSLFIPKHPKTKARIEDVLKMEEKLSVEELIKDALVRTETEISGGL